MKCYVIPVLFLLVSLVFPGQTELRGQEEKSKGKPQTQCPVMGGKIDKAHYADVEGKRIYFCCKGCPKIFLRNPAPFIKRMESQGIALATVTHKPQTLCPVMGNKIKKDVFMDYKGKRIYFCCPGCDDGFLKSADEYIRKMESQGIVLDKAPLPQSLCPVMGNKIKKDVFVDYKGKRVYFCCPGCDDTFLKSADMYIRKMEAEGVTLDTAPAKILEPTPGKILETTSPKEKEKDS